MNEADAASTCTVGGETACNMCVFGKCCDSYGPCAKDDDCFFALGGLAECVANDPASVTQCYDDFAATNAAASALRMCVKTNCDTPCKTMTP
jgi:hypothetical protein